MNRLFSSFGFNERIAAIGAFASLTVALVFLNWTGELSDHRAIAVCTILGVTLQLGVWFFNSFYQEYAFSLLSVLTLTLIACFLPFGLVLVSLIGIILAALYVRQLLRKVLPPKIKTGLSIFSIVIGIAYGLVIFAATSNNVGDSWIDEKLRQMTLNCDSLFFSSMSTMFIHYGHMSTGLHGFVWERYHTLAFGIYACISRLLHLTPYQVYGYVNYIVFAPLLVTGYLHLTNQIQLSQPLTSDQLPKPFLKWMTPEMFSWLLINVVVFSCGFSETYRWQEEAHFISESYLNGLLLMSGGMAILFSFARKPQVSTRDLIVLFIYLVFSSIGKISVGFIFTASAMISVVFKKDLKLNQKVGIGLLVAIGGLIGHECARTIPIPDLEARFEWGYYLHHTNSANAVSFYIHSLPYAFFILPLFALLAWKKELSNEKLIWFLIAGCAGAIGFLGLNMTLDGSCYYFSNVHAWVTIPVLVIALMKWSKDYTRIVSACMLVFLFGTPLYYFRKVLLAEFNQANGIRTQIRAYQKPENPYLGLLRKVSEDPDRSMMVYIPKSETGFWLNQQDTYSPWRDQQCLKTPFFIPILSGKPAIYGLPDPATCKTFFRGYESYALEDFAASAKSDHSESELCAEVIRLGFQSYARVTLGKGVEKFVCHP